MTKADPRSLDHFVLSAHDLDESGANYERLGFRVLPRVKHIEIGTSNRVIQFKSTYIELLGDVALSLLQPKEKMLPRFEAGEGLSIVSLTSDDLEADHEHIISAGRQPDPIISARRKITMPDGSEDETDSCCFYVWRDGKEYLTLFYCAHYKPETIFVPAYYENHPNTAVEITGVTYVSADPAADRDYFSLMFGGAPAHAEAGWLRFEGKRGDVTDIYSLERLRKAYPGVEWPTRLPLSGYPVGLRVAVRFIDRARRVLIDNGVSFESSRHGLFIQPQYANGAFLEFADDPAGE